MNRPPFRLVFFTPPIDRRKRPPYPPRKEPPVGVRKAMTMVAGFECREGVVLCGDTEITVPGWIKFPGSKLRLYNKLKCRANFAFAGDVSFCGMFIHKLVLRIGSAEKDGKGIFTSVEDEVWAIHQKFRMEKYEQNSVLILSLWQGAEGKKRRKLYRIARGIIEPAQIVTAGTGTLVTQGMVTELFSPDLSLKHTALLAIYLLAEAKTYGGGVGKDSQILLLPHSGWWSPFPEDPDHSTVKEVEEDYIRLKSLLRPILAAYSDIDVDENAFTSILQDFAKRAAYHKKQRFTAYEHLIEREIEWQITQAEEGKDDEEENEDSS